MTTPFVPLVCAYQGCYAFAEYEVTSPSSERLNEHWYCCECHAPRCKQWLIGREKVWGFPSNRVRIVALAG